jgi:hypothetical protein
MKYFYQEKEAFICLKENMTNGITGTVIYTIQLKAKEYIQDYTNMSTKIIN